MRHDGFEFKYEFAHFLLSQFETILVLGAAYRETYQYVFRYYADSGFDLEVV